MDERTPHVKTLAFRNIEASNCHVAAAYLCGLPEKKIDRVEMEHVHVTYADNPMSGQPAMMDDCRDDICRMGIYAGNIGELILRDVTVNGQEGPELITENVDKIVR